MFGGRDSLQLFLLGRLLGQGTNLANEKFSRLGFPGTRFTAGIRSAPNHLTLAENTDLLPLSACDEMHWMPD